MLNKKLNQGSEWKNHVKYRPFRYLYWYSENPKNLEDYTPLNYSLRNDIACRLVVYPCSMGW